MTGRIGATYHISFPVVNRASFGVWGALWPVFNRAAMACSKFKSLTCYQKRWKTTADGLAFPETLLYDTY
jgi:hypothetical protein